MKKLFAMILMAVLAISCFAFAEEGQNPAMNVVGDYQDTVSQRATMTIAPSGDNEAEVTIRWANSADETVEWHFVGACKDDDGLVIEYNNCTKKVVAADGEKVEYENGTGTLTFDAEMSNPVWKDDQEDAGKDCKFEFAPVNNTAAVGSVEIDENEAAVREKMGEPAAETETAGLKDLCYNNITVAGHEAEVHFLIGDDMVRAIRIATRNGNGDVANDFSELSEELSNGADPELTEDQIKNLATKYCGLTDFSELGYFTRFAKDGSWIVYIRTSEKNIDLLILDQYLQNQA